MARSIAPPGRKLLDECRDARRLRHRIGQDHARLSSCRRSTSSTRSGRCGTAASTAKPELLASCYRTALALAAEHGLQSIAFPAISTGVYRFPADLAARIAVGTVVSEISADARGIKRVVFCCFSKESAEHHINAFAELGLA